MTEVKVSLPENSEVTPTFFVTLPSDQLTLLMPLMVVNESVGYEWRNPQEYFLL